MVTRGKQKFIQFLYSGLNLSTILVSWFYLTRSLKCRLLKSCILLYQLEKTKTSSCLLLMPCSVTLVHSEKGYSQTRFHFHSMQECRISQCNQFWKSNGFLLVSRTGHLQSINVCSQRQNSNLHTFPTVLIIDNMHTKRFYPFLTLNLILQYFNYSYV